LARSRGFIDPIQVVSRLHRFAQPSEVAEPIELLRAGLVFHARGLINTKAIQHNLDWVWPFWVERQFDPRSASFVPRAFSLTHVNLTHRNWTAVGQPGVDLLPVVDPAGLLTPHFDGWSIDLWIIPDRGRPLLPSRGRQAHEPTDAAPRPAAGSAAAVGAGGGEGAGATTVDQRLDLRGNLRVATRARDGASTLSSIAEVVMAGGVPTARLAIKAMTRAGGWLVVAIRPANPEGVSFIHDAAVDPGGAGARVNKTDRLSVSEAADRWVMSTYREGDVYQRLTERSPVESVSCDVGMATAAAMYRLGAGEQKPLTVRAPLVAEAGGGPMPERRRARAEGAASAGRRPWREALDGLCGVELPDAGMQRLFHAAVRSLILHAPGDIYPGPYTYKRFWFRDAAFIGHALLNIGAADALAPALDRFPERQTARGYFKSQEGEWDSNGQAIWLLDRFSRLTGRPLSATLTHAVEKGARWIGRKRCDRDKPLPHAGLMPAGFSAEHLGPNDYYYWDDFWSIAGLRAAASILGPHDAPAAADAADEAHDLARAVERSIARTGGDRDRRGVPASPYRRMDGGAIGSLAADYPTALWPAGDRRMIDTVEFLLGHYLVHGGFFQDMIHSGVNAYLTLHLAQALLRAGDPRHFELMENVAALASPTGQWPEAIHPGTGGGCMGDGHHVWAAAEWVMIVRNCFVREEGGALVLGSGLPRGWLEPGARLSLGPTPTPWGPLTLTVEPAERETLVRWSADWRGKPPRIDVRLPDGRAGCSGRQNSLVIPRGGGRPASRNATPNAKTGVGA